MNSRKRLTIALLPLVLFASTLGTGTLLGQDAEGSQPLAGTPEAILPGAVVSVLGDGFMGSPTAAPVRRDDCRTSQNGPVEQAARRITDTAVLVQNFSCPGSTMTEVIRDQVPQIRVDSDVVVVGGLGLEFDWPSLAAACLTPQTRSISRCQDESGLARANASNATLLWMSFLQQARRIAPDATVVIVAPPLPVSDRPNVLGHACCGVTIDTHEQVRAVFGAAGSLRQAVVDADRSPLLLIESDDLFEQHRLDDSASWLVRSGAHVATANERGTAMLADLLTPAMPVGELPPTAEDTEVEIALIVGATTADRVDHEALAAAASDWFDRHERADTIPSVVVVPAAATRLEPEPDAELEQLPTEREADSAVPEREADSAVPEREADSAVPEREQPVGPADESGRSLQDVDRAEGAAGLPEETVPEETADTGDDEQSEPVLIEPAPPVPILIDPIVIEPIPPLPILIDPIVIEPIPPLPDVEPPPLPTIRDSADDLADDLRAISTVDGITTLDDLEAAILLADSLLEAPADQRSIIVRVESLRLPTADDGSFADLTSSVQGRIEIIAPDPDLAASLGQMTLGANVVLSTAATEELGGSLPAPDPVERIDDFEIADSFEFVIDQPESVEIYLSLTQPVSAEITWWIEGSIVATGQRPVIDPSAFGVGRQSVEVFVTTDRIQLVASTRFFVTPDGDGVMNPDSCPTTFDQDENDIDRDGRTASCDEDDDGDGIPDELDPCPFTANTNLFDSDLDGLPNVCDRERRDGPAADSDRDGVPDLVDNCPTVASLFQTDSDADGIGNACEAGTVNRVCTITGTQGNDRLVGTAGDDVICGLGGDDTIVGGGGDDIIFGGTGNDELVGAGGSDLLYGGSGDDEIFGNGSSDLILGEDGDDRIDGGLGADTIDGGFGNDSIDGGRGDDVVFGSFGSDELSGGNGSDVISGGPGADTLLGQAGPDRLFGGLGLDADTVLGGAGNDVVLTAGPSDTVGGGSETDLIDDGVVRIG